MSDRKLLDIVSSYMERMQAYLLHKSVISQLVWQRSDSLGSAFSGDVCLKRQYNHSGIT